MAIIPTVQRSTWNHEGSPVVRWQPGVKTAMLFDNIVCNRMK
jgi:hypothetical protein